MAVSKKLMAQLEKVNVDDILKMSMQEASDHLVNELRLFAKEKDLKLFILEYLTKAFVEDHVDWPVRYYEEHEEIDPAVDTEAEGIEMLTNDYIQMELKSVPSNYERP